MTQDIPPHHLGQRFSHNPRLLIETQIPAPRVCRVESPIFLCEMAIQFQRNGVTFIYGNIKRAIARHDQAIAIGVQMDRIGAQPPIPARILRIPLSGDGRDRQIMARTDGMMKEGEQGPLQCSPFHPLPPGARQ